MNFLYQGKAAFRICSNLLILYLEWLGPDTLKFSQATDHSFLEFSLYIELFPRDDNFSWPQVLTERIQH